MNGSNLIMYKAKMSNRKICLLSRKIIIGSFSHIISFPVIIFLKNKKDTLRMTENTGISRGNMTVKK